MSASSGFPNGMELSYLLMMNQQVMQQQQLREQAAAAAAAKQPKPAATGDEAADIQEEQAEIFSQYIPSIKLGGKHPAMVVESGLLR